jgi:hypothetical protein
MKWILAAGAILLFLAGLVAVASIRSDIQVIVAVLCFGFSFSIMGLGGEIGATEQTEMKCPAPNGRVGGQLWYRKNQRGD